MKEPGRRSLVVVAVAAALLAATFVWTAAPALAVGYFGLRDTRSITDGLPPAAFYSSTGATWRRDGLLPNYGYRSEDGDRMTDAAASGTRIVAVGHYNDPDPGSYYAGGLVTTGIAHP
jgi:hypothetical protein